MADESGGGGMRLTGAGRAVLFLVGLAVFAYVGYTYRDQIMSRIRPRSGVVEAPATTPTPSTATTTPEPRKGVLGRIKQTGVLRVGMEPDAPPLHFLNDRKQEDGFDFRLAGIVAASLGAKRIEVVEADYEELPDRL